MGTGLKPFMPCACFNNGDAEMVNDCQLSLIPKDLCYLPIMKCPTFLLD